MTKLRLETIGSEHALASFEGNSDLINLSKKGTKILKVYGRESAKKGIDSIEISFYTCKELGILR